MESDKNDINNEGDEHQHQQLRGNARKRKLNELANDEDQPAPADQDHQQKPENYSKKNRGEQHGNDALEVCTAGLKNGIFLKSILSNRLKNLHLETLTREELIQLVRKQNETTTRQAEVYFAFLGILFGLFDIEIILLGIFQTEHPIGAGEGGSSGRFASKNGRNCENAQGN
jgi:hypothetical protein